MFNKLKLKFQSEEKKRLLSNFFSLFILQGSNYIFPLITFPYLVRILGPEKFGLLGFAGAIISYFTLLINFGFELSAIRQISIHKENKEKVSQIYSSIISIQLLAFLLCSIILIVSVFSFEKLRIDQLVYYLMYISILGAMMFPSWFYQGMENMKYITYLNLLSKIVYTVCIFLFIHQEEDFIYVPLIGTFLAFIIGIISLWIIKNIFYVKYKIPNFSNMMYQLKEGWHLFVSNIAVNIYTTSIVFFLGIFTNNETVGYYTAGEKIIRAVHGLMQPINQTIYPYIAKLVNESKQAGILFIRKVFILVGSLTMVFSVLIFIFAPEIVNIILGNNYQHSVVVVQLLSFSLLIVAMSNIFGIQTMLNYGMKKEFSKILLFGGFLSLILSIIFIPIYREIGASMSVILTEIFVTVSMFFYLRKKGIMILEGKVI